jgi:hypothetical protein
MRIAFEEENSVQIEPADLSFETFPAACQRSKDFFLKKRDTILES